MRIIQLVLLVLTLSVFHIEVQAQMTIPQDQDSLPNVFLIGQHDKAYGKLLTDNPDLLLSVCDNSMEMAFEKWVNMLHDMEVYAEQQNFDIKGIKMWINVFWNSDGTIEHIAYFPKPNSKNMDYEELTAFIADFIRVYKLDLSHEKGYSHYGSASFPTFSKNIFQEAGN